MVPGSASQVVAMLDLKAHPEGGFYSETFRDDSVVLTKSQLPPQCTSALNSSRRPKIYAILYFCLSVDRSDLRAPRPLRVIRLLFLRASITCVSRP